MYFHRHNTHFAAVQLALVRRRYVNGHTVVRSTERPIVAGHQIDPQRSPDFGDASRTQQVLEALLTAHTEAHASTVVLVAVEAMALLEVVERIADNAHERTHCVNALEHKLMAAHVIARQKMLDARKKRRLVVGELFDHAAIAAGISETAVRIEVDVTDRLTHAKACFPANRFIKNVNPFRRIRLTATRKRCRIRVNNVHKFGVGRIQPHQRIRVTKQRLGRIHSRDPAQHQTKVALQRVPRVATQMGAQRVAHHVHFVQIGQSRILVDHVDHVRRDRTDQPDIGHRLRVGRRRSGAPVDNHHGRRPIMVVVQQCVDHVLDLHWAESTSFECDRLITKYSTGCDVTIPMVDRPYR